MDHNSEVPFSVRMRLEVAETQAHVEVDIAPYLNALVSMNDLDRTSAWVNPQDGEPVQGNMIEDFLLFLTAPPQEIEDDIQETLDQVEGLFDSIADGCSSINVIVNRSDARLWAARHAPSIHAPSMLSWASSVSRRFH